MNDSTTTTDFIHYWDSLPAELQLATPANIAAGCYNGHPFVRTERERLWPNGTRLTWAWRLAKDLVTLADIIAGRPVDPDHLNQQELFIARNHRLVRFDTAAIDAYDLLNHAAAVRQHARDVMEERDMDELLEGAA